MAVTTARPRTAAPPAAEAGTPSPSTTPALVAIVAVSALMLGTGVEILPAGGLLSVFTLGRVLILAGLVALVVGGARLADFRTALDIPIALLLMAGVVTTFRGGHEVAPLRFLITVVALYYLTVGVWRRHPEARETLPVVALIAIVASAVVGVAQVAQDTPTSFYRDGFSPVVSTVPRGDLLQRAIGSFDNPNLLATHILLFAPIGALAALLAPTRSLRVVAIALVGLAYIGLLLTFSRAGIGAGLLALAVVAHARRPAWRPRILAGAALATALLGLGVAVTGGDLVGGFGRPEAWSLAARVAVEEQPLTGIGLSRAGDVMNALGDEEIRFRHAHNLWLTWWVEAGPIALFAVLWITAWLLLRGYHEAARGSAVATAALAASVGFFAFSMLDHPANVERIATAFWLVAALMAAGTVPGRGSSRRSRGDNETQRPRPPRPRPPRPATRTLATLVALAAVAGVTGCGGKEDEPEPSASSREPGAAAPPTGAPGRDAPADDSAPAGESPRGARPPDEPSRPDGPPAAPLRPSAPATPGGEDGGSEPVRAEALVTGRGGRFTPRLVRVPPYIAVRLVVRSGDGADYQLKVGSEVASTEGPGTAAELDGLPPGERYVARGNAGRVVIEASAEPGP